MQVQTQGAAAPTAGRSPATTRPGYFCELEHCVAAEPATGS